MKQIAKVKMVKKDPCPYCDRAMNFLNGKGVEVEIVDLTNNLDQLQVWKEKTGWQTVPMIFINDELVGGYTDLKALDEDGQFDKKVFGS